MNSLRGWLGCFFLLWSTAAVAAPSYREFTLDNGLRVILVRETKAPVVVSQVWYGVGAADEPQGLTGLSHMLEHMMFQGTKEIPPGEFSRRIAQNGGKDNASTALDYTNYYIKLASGNLDLALSLEADRMRNLKLDEKKFRSENLVVKEERRSRTDSDPNTRFAEKFRARVYGQHPYGRPVVGWMADIRNHNIKAMQEWYQRHYAPNNAILVLVGDLTLETAEKKVRTHFSGLAPHPGLKRDPLPEIPTQSEGTRFEVSDKGATLPMWHTAFPVPTLVTGKPEQVFALDLLAELLGGSGSSRLYRKLVVEQELAVSIQARYGGYSRGWELFTVTAMPKPGVRLKTLEKAVFAEIKRIQEDPIPDRERQRAVNGMVAGHVFAQDSIYHLAWTIGRLGLNGVDWHILVDEYPQRMWAVTAGDVRQAAVRYLQPKRAIIGVLRP